jgi:threonine/homoserine/homoserine lactone efflux protein
MTVASVGGTALIALTMALTPGPNMIYLVSRSLAQGWRAGSCPWPEPRQGS